MKSLLPLLLTAILPWLSHAGEPASGKFRIGVSYASFGTVSRNDASAALKAWAATVIRERQLDIAAEVEVFERESDLREALERDAVDAASMTAYEFMRSDQRPDELFVTAKNSGFTEQYVLLVHRGAGLTNRAALKGGKLARHDSPATSPALPWLDNTLSDAGLGSAEGLFSEILPLDSPSRTVLRVYFRQSDACLVSTNAFAVACELNPQLRKDLQVLAVSPPVIPTLFFFRPGYQDAVRGEMRAAILDVHNTPAGQQVLTVFQGSRMESVPVAAFETTRQILSEHERRLLPGAEAQESATAAILTPPAS